MFIELPFPRRWLKYIHTLTQEVDKLSKTVSELVISKQSGQSNSLNQPSYSFSPQQNVQLTCYSCNFPGHKRKDCNWNVNIRVGDLVKFIPKIMGCDVLSNR
jgi:hypothetical protein